MSEKTKKLTEKELYRYVELQKKISNHVDDIRWEWQKRISTSFGYSLKFDKVIVENWFIGTLATIVCKDSKGNEMKEVMPVKVLLGGLKAYRLYVQQRDKDKIETETRCRMSQLAELVKEFPDEAIKLTQELNNG